MPEAFSLNREYDFVRLEGLQRATGRPSHEWDLYILKELLDNALDADEVLWYRAVSQFPDISVDIEYISMPPPQRQQLLVRVGNRASFPTEKIEDIFATQWYTSRKAFLKGLTRGTLGNALKTLLGIPYALHNRLAEDWHPDLKPLSICLAGTEYLPRYTIDPITQEIRLTVETKSCRYQPGTVISIGLDYFVQEIPRTQEELAMLATLYHICNPHAAFRWSIEIEDSVWEQQYLPQRDWMEKYFGKSPIHWYSLADFKELLGALYREQNQNSNGGASSLSIANICRYFSGFKPSEGTVYTGTLYPDVAPLAVLQEVQQDSLSAADIEGAAAKKLYDALSKHTLQFPPARLGAIGRDFLEATLKEYLPMEGEIQYLAATEPEADRDPSMPFVLEVAAAHLKGGKRQLWTALNFSPTYNDPFLSRYLYAPVQPNTPVLGLRGVLDAYNMREDTPLLLFVHLICPTIEHNEFSKTEINHLPFKKVLGDTLGQLLTNLRRSQEEDELQFEQTVYQTLNTVMAQQSEQQRFTSDQLLELLRQQPALVPWLERPDTLSRLRIYINAYQMRNPTASSFVTRQADVLLHLPSHPMRYFSIPLDQLSSDLLAQHSVNKLLYAQMAELEPMMLANNWLCRMDMALLHAPWPGRGEEALLYCAQQCDLPLLILHNGDEAGLRLAEQARRALKPFGNEQHVIDLHPPAATDSDALESWLLQRFEQLGIAVKSAPPPAQIRQDLSTQFEQRLRGYFMERMGQRFEITNLLIELDRSFAYSKMMMEHKLDQRLLADLQGQLRSETYSTAVSEVAEDFFEEFMDEYGGKVRQREQLWLEERREKRHDK
jgi:hypothetical protein